MDTTQKKRTSTRTRDPRQEERTARTRDPRQEERTTRSRPTGKTGSRTRRASVADQENKRPSGQRTRRGSAQESSRKAAPQRRRPAVKRTQKPHSGQTAVQSAPAPEVVYTPAKPFNRGRLVLQLATVVAVVLALTFGISIFFKVENITVSGADKYDAWTVKEASGIEIGDNLLTFGEAKAAGKIKTALPYVETVRIGIKLPDTVNIEIKELDVVYSIKDAAGNWWLITAEGRVVDKADSATAGENTTIEGVQLASPAAGQQAAAYEPQIDAPDAAGTTDETAVTTAPVTTRGSDRLAAALSILQYLEECGIIGEAASVDVSDLGDLELWYGQRFQVKLGDTTQLLYKIKCMNAAINGDDEANSLKEYDSGVLDVSFTIKEDQVIYQAFDE